MKNIKTKLLTIVSVIGLVTTALLFNSCSDEATIESDENRIVQELGEFKKEIEIFDKSKENSVVLLIGSNDISVLNMWSAKNFDLNIIDENQSLEDFFKSVNKGNNRNATNEDSSEEVAAEIGYTIIRKNINASGKRYFLQENPPYNEDVRGWSYSTLYSDADASSTHTVTANIYGRNAWKRGYFGVQYKKYSYSGYSTIASEWTRIKNNESKSYTRTPCYKMKVRRKYKGTNNSVVIEIEE